MNKVLITVFFLLTSTLAHAQQDYKGQVVDSQTGDPLPYVNIGVFGKGIGTVSDEDGVFHLTIDKARLYPSDVVQFSCMGYAILEKEVSSLEYLFNEYPKIVMQAKSVVLEEVIVTNGASRGVFEVNELVGYQNYGESKFGYWKDNVALGGELATKIRVRKGVRKLNTLFFEVMENPTDSVLVRVNIYELGKLKTKPGENLNRSNENILYTIQPNTKLAIIDLSPFSIFVKDDFYVSLELLKVYGDKPIGLILAASEEKGTYSIRRYASHDKWDLLKESAMAYHLNTTYYSDKKRTESKVLKVQKSKQNISGFVFSARRPLSNIKVKNLTSNEEVISNEKGRYQILGEKNDIISFEAKGYKKMTIVLLEKNNVNVNLVRE